MPVKHATRLVPSEHLEDTPIQRVSLVPPCAKLHHRMTRTTLIAALERLPFVGSSDCMLRMDRDVRDYLVRMLKVR